MKRNYLFEGFLVLALLFLQSFSSTAALVNVSQRSLEGTVETIGSNFITVSQENPLLKTIAKVNIEIKNTTALEDLTSVAELKEGDAVKVKYTEDAGKNVALEVAKITSIEPAPQQL